MNEKELLLEITGIISRWERAEGVRYTQIWLSETGWKAEWIGPQGKSTATFTGDEKHPKVSNLIEDIKEALKTHSEGACIRHIAWPPSGNTLAWVEEPDGGQHHIRVPALQGGITA